MNSLEKVSIKEYLKSFKNPSDIEVLFEDILEKKNEAHDKNIVIRDFTTDNIYIDNTGNLGFNKTLEANEYNIEKLKQEDDTKFLILLINSCLGRTEDEEIKNKLKEGAIVTEENYDQINYVDKKFLPLIASFTNKIKNNQKNIDQINGNQETTNVMSKTKVYSNGKSILKDNIPNGFISLVVFPFIMLYLVLMVALIYWIMVLK